MSVAAEMVVLFKERPTLRRTSEIASMVETPEFIDIWNADLNCWISPAGELEFLARPRSGKLMGERSLDGRMYQGDLGRYWDRESYIDYGGDPIKYSTVLSNLMNQPDIEYVWYGRNMDEGCRNVQPVTKDWLQSFFATK